MNYRRPSDLLINSTLRTNPLLSPDTREALRRGRAPVSVTLVTSLVARHSILHPPSPIPHPSSLIPQVDLTYILIAAIIIVLPIVLTKLFSGRSRDTDKVLGS